MSLTTTCRFTTFNYVSYTQWYDAVTYLSLKLAHELRRVDLIYLCCMRGGGRFINS